MSSDLLNRASPTSTRLLMLILIVLLVGHGKELCWGASAAVASDAVADSNHSAGLLSI